MSYINVDVPLREILDQIDDDDLQNEIEKRVLPGKSMNAAFVEEKLIIASDKLRLAGDTAIAAWLDDIRIDVIAR